jgi:hypothetical protein
MCARRRLNDVTELYAPEASVPQDRTTPAAQALGLLADAWRALAELEASLPADLARWDAESLVTARKGTQRAWLALSNLDHNLRKSRGQVRNDAR